MYPAASAIFERTEPAPQLLPTRAIIETSTDALDTAKVQMLQSAIEA